MDQQNFSRFIRRAVDDAKDRREWTVSRLAEETGIGRSTLFRWLAGDFQQFPELASVHAFCAALDIPVSAAFSALGVRPGPRPGETDADVHADIERILARLENPRVSKAEKVVIRDMLRYLARRPESPSLASGAAASGSVAPRRTASGSAA